MSTITRYKARFPGEADGAPTPAIFINEATALDYVNAPWQDADCATLQTAVYYWSAAGRKVAERIVRDLRMSGVALIYPGDHDLRVYPGAKHRVIEIGGHA